MEADSFDPIASKHRCIHYRRRILEISQNVSALHVGGSFSCLEIVDTIYFGLMNRHATPPDTFILSKGHGALAQYVVLEKLGILSKHDLDRYSQRDGQISTHPDYGTPGIEVSSGSLGHGLAMACGMAYADKTRQENRSIYVVMSDGELQEGSVWEAMQLAPSLNLSAVVAVIDLNDFQSFGRTSEHFPNFYPVQEKCEAFGWECCEVPGHDPAAIYEAIHRRTRKRPFIAIAKTVKGKGISYMENVPIWHYRSPSPEEYQQALHELALQAEKL